MGSAPLVAVGAAMAGLLALPVVATGGGATAAACGGDDELRRVLHTIRSVESGGRYDAPPGPGGASGAYQYVASTWRAWAGRSGVDTARYPAAYLAPAGIQDGVAAGHVEVILARHGDVAAVPLSWYWPRAVSDPGQLDVVPRPDVGNRLTPREYQARWLEVYEQVPSSRGAPSCLASGTADGYALPLDRALIDANPTMLAAPHHDYPAVDLPARVGTPVHAVRGGVVSAVTTWSGTCASGDSCPDPCGIGVLIDGDDGTRWVYCHGSRLDVSVRERVAAGQAVMVSGNSGRSRGPHLHLAVSVSGAKRCPQTLLAAIYGTGQGVAAASLPTKGCFS